MSQKKTVVPGLGQDVDYNPNNQFSGGNQEYIRPMGMGRPKGTVYPGMNQIQGVSNENQLTNHKTNPNLLLRDLDDCLLDSFSGR